MLRTRGRSARRRPAFTMIEMVIVIAIILVLVGLTTAAVTQFIGVQRKLNTKSELTRVEGELQKQYRIAADQYAKEYPTPGSTLGNVYSNVLQQAGGDQGRAQVIWVKLRLKQTFPNTFNEALNPAPLPPLPYYQQVLGNLGYTANNTTGPQAWEASQPWTESSICLLLALQRGSEGGGIRVEDLGVSSFIHNFGPSPNGQMIQGLVDGWGTPLVFSRWPVNDPKVLNPPNGQAQNKDNNDPGDPSGLLESPLWNPNSAGYKWFLTVGHALGAPPQGKTDATSYRIFPLVASCGPNGTPEIDPKSGLPQPGQTGSGVATFAVPAASLNTGDDLYPSLAPTQ